jgi:uncharacterized protein
MPFTVYDALIPPMVRGLENLSRILDKSVAQWKSEDQDLNLLLEARLAPDMHPLPRQIQITSDVAKMGAAKLAGVEPPSFPDEEKSFPELQQRIAKTLDYIRGFQPEQYEGAEARAIVLKFPSGDMSLSGRDYLTGFVLPNFYFHITMAYGLLRHNGIAIGKMDYLGPPSGT